MENNDETLEKALRNLLEKKGVINDIKARLRAELYHAMDDCAEARRQINKNKEIAFINELIRGYLLFHNYKYASSVFEAEAGLSKTPMEIDHLSNELQEDIELQLPILQSVIRRNLVNQRK